MKKLFYLTLILSFTLISGSASIAREPTEIDDEDIAYQPADPAPPWLIPIDYNEGPAQGTKVAFVGDSSGTPALFELIRDEGADMLIFGGDAGYSGSSFIPSVETYLDDNGTKTFPVFFTRGNHDSEGWTQWSLSRIRELELQEGRQICKMANNDDLAYGQGNVCKYKGIMFAQLGVFGHGYGTNLVNEEFTNNKSHWELCSQHYPPGPFATNDKRGGGIFPACFEHGAPVFNGHTHTYGRTLTLNGTDWQNPRIPSDPDYYAWLDIVSPHYPIRQTQNEISYLFLNDGDIDGLGPIPIDEKSFFIVDSSLGGRPPRGAYCADGQRPCWVWDKTIGSNGTSSASPAVLFGIFNFPLTGNPELDKRAAVFYLKTVRVVHPINGYVFQESQILDFFVVISNK